jgi:hypothetical protein
MIAPRHVSEQAADPARDNVAAARVGGILASAHRRWLEFSTRRLEQFGFVVDQF